MKVELLYLNTANKPSLISEGVAEIPINSQSCKGINLTTWHMQVQRASRDVTKKSDRVLPHPSIIFYAYASIDTPWVARTLSHYTSVKWGKISSNSSTHEATQFEDFICLVCISIFKCLFNRAQPMQDLIDTGGGYHLGALNIRSDHFPSFLSSILHFSLIAPLSLILNHSTNYSSSQHYNLEPGYKSPKSRE
jgi:hypothetical protein